MAKATTFLILFISFIAYSAMIYTNGTESKLVFTPEEQHKILKGKLLFQKHNCNSCHQVYGLGGYLGPELTTAWSDKNRGEKLIRAMLSSGGNRMPDFKFNHEEIDHITQYLRYIDTTATTYKDL